MANNRFNVKNVHFAKNTTAAGGTVTREKPRLIAGAMSVTVNPTVSSGTLYGDGVIADEVAKLTGAGISLEMNKIPTTIVNEIYGKTKDSNGMTVDSVDDEAIEFSLGWEVELTGGQSEFIWFTRCKAQPMQSEVQQGTDSINFSTDTCAITAMPDEEGRIRMFGETVDADFTLATTWFASVPPEPPTGG